MITNYLLLTFCILALLCSVMIIVSKNPIHSILYLILVFCNVTFVLIILGVELLAITFLIVYVGAIAVLFLFVVMMLNIKILELDEIFWKYIPIGLFISSIFLFQIFYYIFKFNIFDVYNIFTFSGVWFLKKVTLISDSPFSGFAPSLIDNTFLNSGVYSVSDLKASYFSEIYLFNNNLFVFNKSVFGVDVLGAMTAITNTELLGWLIYTYTFFVFFVVAMILLIAMVGSIVLVLNQNINIKRQLIFRQTLRDLQSSIVLKR